MKIFSSTLACAVLSLVFLLLSPFAFAQDAASVNVEISTAGKMRGLIETGLTSLYNLDFPAAYSAFHRLSDEYPDSPIGPYALSTALWWELVNEHDEENQDLELRFLSSANKTVEIAKKRIDAGDDSGEAELCLGGALGFKSRWEAIQGHWVRAYRNGRGAYNAQKEAIEKNPELYDAYLGVGIFHYYTATLPAVVKVLARLVVRGDKQQGLKEIRLAMTQGHFSRTAARLFLIGIYNNQEKDYGTALSLVREGRMEYPNSSFFHLLEMLTLENAGDWSSLRNEAEDFLERVRLGTPSYRPEYAHRGRFFLANSYLWEGDLSKSVEAYSDLIANSAIQDRWMTWTYLNRGRAYDRLGERQKAVLDYRAVKARRNVWDLHDRAEAFLDNPDRVEKTAER